MFIEQKIKTPIPSYFKYVLKACGFNNGLTIASIDDEDIQYFEQEIRNGNVSAYYKNAHGLEVLDGYTLSSTKSTTNFEFTRGHIKLLLYIRDFIKKWLEENGTIALEKVHKNEILKRKNNGGTIKSNIVPRKKTKYCLNELSHSDVSSSPNALQKERSVLLGKAITSLIRHTPEMYVKARVKVKFTFFVFEQEFAKIIPMLYNITENF